MTTEIRPNSMLATTQNAPTSNMDLGKPVLTYTTSQGNTYQSVSPERFSTVVPPNQPKTPKKPRRPTKNDTWQNRIGVPNYNILTDTFRIFDEDNSGFIDPAQINKALNDLGTEGRNPFVMGIITSLQEKDKPLSLQEFVETVCSKVGDTTTREGIETVFDIYDMNGDGLIDFEEFKHVAKWIKQGMNDDDLLEMLHSSFVNNHFKSNEHIDFQEFYSVVVKFAAEQ